MKQCILSGMRVLLIICLYIGLANTTSFALDPPTGVSASDGTYTSEVRVTWNSVSGATHYLVYRDNRPTSRLWQPSTTFHDTGATPGQVHNYKVQAATSEYGDNPSGYSTSNPGWRKLSPPTGVRVSTAFTDKVMIVWDSVPGATHYLVYRDDAPISTWQMNTEFHDTGTAPGQVHNYKVQAATSASGNKPSDLSAPVSGWRKLSPPTGVTASDGTYTDRIQITWNPVPGATHYMIYSSDDPTQPFAPMDRGWFTNTTFISTGAIPGKTYYYKVKAAMSEYGDKRSGFSAIESGWQKLSRPTGVWASDGTFTDRIRVTWYSVPGATHYLVYRGATPGSVTPVPSGWQTSRTFDDTNVIPGQTYYYKVQAATSGNGYRSSALSAAESGWRKLSSPTSVSASDGTFTDKVQITWNSVPSATHYLVYRGITPSSMTPMPEGWQTSRTFNDTNATPGQIYYYKVRAAMSGNGYRPSNFSAIDSGWRKLSRPTGVSASDGTYPNKVRVTWNSVAGASHYRVYRNTNSNSSGAIALGNWQPGTAYDDLSVSTGQTYWYWVKAATRSSGARASALSNYNTGYADNSVPWDPCYCPPGQICPTVECEIFSPISSGPLDENIVSDGNPIPLSEPPDQKVFPEKSDSDISAVPEPTTVVLFVLGLLGLAGFLQRSRKKF